MGREVGGGFRMGNTCKTMADSCQLWQKPLQYCKVISLQLIKIIGGGIKLLILKKKKDVRKTSRKKTNVGKIIIYYFIAK